MLFFLMIIGCLRYYTTLLAGKLLIFALISVTSFTRRQSSDILKNVFSTVLQTEMREKMSSENNENNENKQSATEPVEASDFEFLQERIKERPINKRKLLQRTIVTALLALLFGVLACLTFLLLEPVLSNWLYPEEEPNIVSFPQEQDEMLPEDMLTEETSSIVQEEEQETAESADSNEQTTAEDAQSESIGTDEDGENPDDAAVFLEEYRTQYDELYDVYREVSTSMVTVTAVRTDTDWFNNPYQSEGSAAGVIIANNNRELLILTKKELLDDAENIRVRFCNGVNANADIKEYDANTNLAVLAVGLQYLGNSTLEYISVATLGSSDSSGDAGTPVIAVGNLFGYSDNVCYGMVTSKGTPVFLADSEYKLITTDIYASENPSGILVNISGDVIGIIDNSYNNKDTKNLLSAVGITELMDMILKLSNGEQIPYLGMHVQDIPNEARSELGLPQGAYIFNMDMDSPAMLSGIQRGDIIVQVGLQEIRSASDYMETLLEAPIGKELRIVVYRESLDDYEQMEFTVQPAQQPNAQQK